VEEKRRKEERKEERKKHVVSLAFPATHPHPQSGHTHKEAREKNARKKAQRPGGKTAQPQIQASMYLVLRRSAFNGEFATRTGTRRSIVRG
jgi:hypothetical protein